MTRRGRDLREQREKRKRVNFLRWRSAIQRFAIDPSDAVGAGAVYPEGCVLIRRAAPRKPATIGDWIQSSGLE